MLHGDAAVIVNGKFAQFGGRMMVQVSDMLLAQFVENFRQAALALPAPASQAIADDAAVAFGWRCGRPGRCGTRPPQRASGGPGNQRPGHRLGADQELVRLGLVREKGLNMNATRLHRPRAA